MQNKDLPFCIIFVNFTFASRKNKHLREQDAMSNELCITGWGLRPTRGISTAIVMSSAILKPSNLRFIKLSYRAVKGWLTWAEVLPMKTM